jgi:hypothetical protein
MQLECDDFRSDKADERVKFKLVLSAATTVHNLHHGNISIRSIEY